MEAQICIKLVYFEAVDIRIIVFITCNFTCNLRNCWSLESKLVAERQTGFIFVCTPLKSYH